MKSRKILIILAISVIILIIILVIGKKAGWFGSGYMVKVSTELPEKRTIVELITANGKIQPETQVIISADVSGEIVELYVSEGQKINEGDILLKIDPDIYLSTIEQMTAALNSAKATQANSKAYLSQVEAQFKKIELSYQRSETLYNEGAISKADYETALAEYEIAQAEVEAAEQTVLGAKYNSLSALAVLKEAKENLEKTTIYAPISGTISSLNVEKGERVVGTMQFEGTEILTIANMNLMEVQVEVNENDIIRVTKGDTAIIEVDAYFEEKFEGVVTEIANSADVTGVGSDQVTNFEVKITILKESYQHLISENDSTFYPFRPGMSATVDIQTEFVYNVLSVPIQCVTTRADSTGVSEAEEIFVDEKPTDETTKVEDDKTQEVVFVYNAEKEEAEMRVVVTGIQDNNYIEILSGLEMTDEVINAPYSAISKQLKNNLKVKKVEKEELFKTE